MAGAEGESEWSGSGNEARLNQRERRYAAKSNPHQSCCQISSLAQRRKLPPVLSGAFRRNGFPLVEFDRKPLDREPLIAFVLDWGAEVTLVQVFNTGSFRLDGYAVFRNTDVRRWQVIPDEDFLARAAVFNELLPSRPKLVKFGQ